MGGLFMVAVSFHSNRRSRNLCIRHAVVCISGSYLNRRFRDLRISVGAGEKEQVFVAAQVCNSEFKLS